ncbi:MAG: hypothetical protein PHU51_05045 [Candidatus Nanoarchaeia archaeon]|nr:hypothetical protein [Candidatus Nanoarchaeia archaeon]
MKPIFFILILLLSVNLTSAIGISPPSYRTQFQDYKTETFSFMVFTHDGATRINISLDGALAEYAKASEALFNLEAKGSKTVQVTITYPAYEDLTIYGQQRLNVRAEELPQEGAGFSAVTAIVGQLRISIPIPGEYGLINSFTIDSVEKGKNTNANLVLYNGGTEPLIGKNAEINIYSPTGEFQEKIKISDIYIPPQQTLEIKKEIKSQNYIEGRYTADLFFNCSETQETIKASTIFFIGATDIVLEDYTKNVTRGKISPIDLEFQSIWGSPLNAVRASVTYNGKTQDLPVLDFEPFGKKTTKVYLDIPETQYNTTSAELNLKIPINDNQVKDKKIELFFKVLEPAPSKFTFAVSTNIILIGVIVLLILILLTINIYLLTKKKDDKKKSK